MNYQNEQQEMQLVDEASLGQVTGRVKPGSHHLGGQPWNHPFDSPIEAPAASRLIKADPGTNPKLIAKELDDHNQKALVLPAMAAATKTIQVHPNGLTTTTYANGKVYKSNVPL